MRNEAVVVEPLAPRLKDHDRADMHGRRRLLQIEEGRVEGSQTVGHALMVSDNAA